MHNLTYEERIGLKRLIDKRKRELVANGYLNCDPEYLTIRAQDAELMGFYEVAEALTNFRDKVVNPLLGMGLDLNRIEQAAAKHWGINAT